MARLETAEIEKRLEGMEGWHLDGQAIHRRLTASDFAGSVELVNRIAPVAEELGHHPDLAISWNTVDVIITTHSEGGLTAADFELAERIDDLA